MQHKLIPCNEIPFQLIMNAKKQFRLIPSFKFEDINETLIHIILQVSLNANLNHKLSNF